MKDDLNNKKLLMQLLAWLIRNYPPFLCFVITFCWFGIFAIQGIDRHHDGLMLKPAVDVAKGQILFRDSFSQYGAMTTFIQALAIKIFGPMLIVIRLTTVLFYSLSAVLLYYIWRNLLSTKSFWITYGLFLLLAPFYGTIFLPWSSVYALFFMLLANLSMIKFIRHNSAWYLWGAGFSSAFAFLCRQPCGIVMLMALSLCFMLCLVYERKNWRKTLSDFGACVLAYIICMLLFFVYLARNGALADWYFQSVRYIYSFGIESREAGSLLKSLLPETPFIIFPVVTLSFLCISTNALFNPKSDSERQKNLIFVITALIGLASWHQYYPMPCKLHCYWASIPMLGFYALAIQRIVDSQFQERRLKRCSKMILAIILLLPFYGTAATEANNIKENIAALSTRKSIDDPVLKYMRLNEEECKYFGYFQNTLKRTVTKFPDRPWLNLTEDGIYPTYFPNTENLHPMFVNWGNLVYPNYFYQVNAIVAEKRPIVISQKEFEFPGYVLFGYISTDDGPIYFYIPGT